MSQYDFRSDTVTRPTLRMRQAMASAEVGDDVYGEDPTVNRLEARAAELLGKEAALFVTSGTMGNLLAVLAGCERGAEVIMGRQGHTFLHEAGGVSVLGGVSMHTIPNQSDGTLALEDLHGALRDPADFHEPLSRMVILENTQNACGGIPLSAEYTDSVAAFARLHGLVLHIDGARIFNAAVALGVPAAELVRSADSITFCLSKGLCAPVGSVLCSSRETISKARRLRKMLGGGMRQAGIIAAPGIIALQKMVGRLKEDHRNARRLAEGLNQIPGVKVDLDSVQTNIVLADITGTGWDVDYFVNRAGKIGIQVFEFGATKARFVTHYGIDEQDIDEVLSRLRRLLQR